MKTSSIVALVFLLALGGCVYTSCKPVWQYDHLERNAKKVITAAELQAWATNLLARYTNETSLRMLEIRTNVPQRLRDLAPQLGPSVYIHVPDDTNYPPYVQIFWGSGFLGHHGFVIGPTNFTVSGMTAWQHGVYFE